MCSSDRNSCDDTLPPPADSAAIARALRTGRIGSLVLAIPDRDGDLVYVGSVGTGSTYAMLADLPAKLAPLQRETPPISTLEGVIGGVLGGPEIVGEVAFTEWTADQRLRHPTTDQR
ncbi:hypothetical protein [Nocardia sp. NPDC052112]|uniref:ATP dependent DNA ligase n=1 Tax=Nocardia sp. NPDC052112 TaxID=3155646 RepID=UPI003444D1DD